MGLIPVEVIYAESQNKVYHYRFQVQEGTTVLNAVRLSGLEKDCPSLDIATTPMGIFGKKVPHPEISLVTEGSRIELYRPITADPKAIRRQRAQKASR